MFRVKSLQVCWVHGLVASLDGTQRELAQHPEANVCSLREPTKSEKRTSQHAKHGHKMSARRAGCFPSTAWGVRLPRVAGRSRAGWAALRSPATRPDFPAAGLPHPGFRRAPTANPCANAGPAVSHWHGSYRKHLHRKQINDHAGLLASHHPKLFPCWTLRVSVFSCWF